MTAFDDLILLVGTNPLPSYVVACYFLESFEHLSPDARVWLLYSESGPQQISTSHQALRIRLALEKRFNVAVFLYPIRDISLAPTIQEDILNLAKKLTGRRIHFNYSGGTKPMTLHTYRILEQTFLDAASFSYLDGRRFLIISDASGEPLHKLELRSLVQIRFEELIALHHFELYRPYISHIPEPFKASLGYLQDLVEKNLVMALWGSVEKRDGWRYLREVYMKTTTSVQDISRNKYLKLFRKHLTKYAAAFETAHESFSPGLIFDDLMSFLPPGWAQLLLNPRPFELSDLDLQNLYALVRFLDGQWLEFHVFQALTEVLQEQGLKADICMGLELRQGDWKTYFEVDIAALIGYQLLGISCTTYDLKSACKNKGFEIIHRVRQIGGDEIREILKMMLVTYVKTVDQERLQQELSVSTGTGKANILVCGRDDLPLPVLKEQIREFVTYHIPVTTHIP